MKNNNATFINPDISQLYGLRGYATLHENLLGERFTIITIDGGDLWCDDYEVEMDDKEASRNVVNY